VSLPIRRLLVVVVVVAVAALPRPAAAQLIVRDQQYRCPSVDPQCANSTKKLPAFEQHDNYSINFVEVRDTGELWDARQLDEALAQIARARTGGQQPLVFVYIHGWQNNADELPNDPNETDCLKLQGDVAKFRTCGVARLAALSGVAGARPVVGIYLAWHGLSSSIEPFKHLVSYWPRRNKARFVGRTGMFEALDAIVRKVGEHRDDYVLVMLGHSFGARVLEYAAEAVDPGRGRCGFMAGFRARLTTNARARACAKILGDLARQPSTMRSPVDLFVYVNAATSHRMTYKALDDWKNICAKAPANPACSASPMYLATTSRTDFATGLLMPVANAILPALHSDRWHLISAANTFWLHTHHDPVQVKTGCPTPIDPGSFCFEGPQSNTRQNGPTVTYYTRGYRNHTDGRFWIFNTGHRLIRNHGDVWNKRIFNLVMAVVQRRIVELSVS